MKSKKSKRGQIVVFMVLIFQMLFVFIAMMVNIGLVVHDKINLQNSVDFAAIYGAQRQAEILNALAHINYQIRQSYKLLAWRYFILGNLGSNYEPGRYQITSAAPDLNQVNCTGLINASPRGPFGGNRSQVEAIPCPYAVCMQHSSWYVPGAGGSTSAFCQNRNLSGITIQRPSSFLPPSSIAASPFGIGASILQSYYEISDKSFEASCEGVDEVNWWTAASFLYSFRIDQWKRKLLAIELFNQLLAQNKDIEGKDIFEGVRKTLKNNLTFVNYINLNDDDYIRINSSIQGKTFNDYFEWEKITPALFYVSLEDGGAVGSVCKTAIRPIQIPPVSNPSPGPPHLEYSSFGPPPSSSSNPESEYHLSSGFYRTAMPSARGAAVRVQVDIPYNRQIFFPASTIRLKAMAYAKPFGSGFGPPASADTLLPKNRPPISTVSSSSPPPDFYNFLQFSPNHSLYPGDRQGLYNHAVQRAWVENLITGMTSPIGAGYNFLNYYRQQNNSLDPMAVNYTASGNLDPNFFRVKMREMEEQAIAPDLFDLAYYTILPNYMTTLYRKIKSPSNGSFTSSLEARIGGDIPGDLGFFNTTILGLNDFYNLALSRGGCYAAGSPFRLNFIQKQIECTSSSGLPHKVKDTNHLLTSWAPPKTGGYPRLDMYNLDPDVFGQCDKSDNTIQTVGSALNNLPNQNLIPQHCLKGGRSGFSVKLIHKEVGETLF